MFKRALKHFKLINKHRWVVFKLSLKTGIPLRGLMHDLSKYSITEFWESAKYYVGYKSAVAVAREKRQYSKAWLHHKGHNKHHEEYWYDWNAAVKAPIIPYKYAVEMVCDNISAGIVYAGGKWNESMPLKYWREVKDMELFHPQMRKFFEDVYTQVEHSGIDATITKKNLKQVYDKYCNQTNTLKGE